jgi:hypothetical protein
MRMTLFVRTGFYFVQPWAFVRRDREMVKENTILVAMAPLFPQSTPLFSIR